MRQITPLHLVLMLHYHHVAEPYSKNNPEHANSPAVKQFTRNLVSWGLIAHHDDSPSGYCPTQAGRLYVAQLISLKPPILD